MFEVMKKFKIFLSISMAIVLVGAVCLIINHGFVTDIDFSGGAMLQGVQKCGGIGIKEP